MQSQLKILFLDDHAGLRDSLGTFISTKNPNIKFFYASNSQEAKEILEENQDISNSIIDINLDGFNGLEQISAFRAIRPNLNVIIYTMFNDYLHIEQAFQKKIQGYITKDASVEEIEKAILFVSEGNLYFNKNAKQLLHTLLKTDNESRDNQDKTSTLLFENYKSLTKKEKEVFELLSQHKDVMEIASLLGKSGKTISNQTSLIYQKLGIHNRIELQKAAKILGVIL
ncbi:response regulator transcription factor [Treponema sp.]|uniref:response regulator transcription factor n=1 Tax=Treponema sp. TaxID=166 RepID=UPI00298DF4B0|nr:response regulator transcription factor [Treponema sp.]